MRLKLVAITKVYRNIGSVETPMWRPVDVNEYIVAWLTKKPTWPDVGKAINNFAHMLEGKIDELHKEVYCGFEIYDQSALTHSENFLLQTTGTIDFPVKDLTEVDVSEEMDGLQQA